MRMRVRTSTTAYHSVSGKRERLPYNGAGALALQRDFRSSILSYSILFALCSMLRAPCFVTTR
jgi:hypothetical protein